MSKEQNLYANFYQFLEKVADFVAILEPDGRIVKINENGRLLLALFDENYTHFHIADLLADGQDDFATMRDTAVSTGVWQGELNLFNPEGLKIPVSAKLAAHVSEAGDIEILSFIANDITDRKWVESSLQESELRFQSAFNNTAAGTSIFSVDGRFLQVNEAFCNFTGYTQKELMQMSIPDILHPDMMGLYKEEMPRLRSGEITSLQVEARYLSKAGVIRWSINNVGSLYDVNGNLLGFMMHMQDVTEEKTSEANLQKLSSAVEQAANPVVITDIKGCVEYVNPAFEELTGYTEKEIAGKTLSVLKSGMHDEKYYKGLWETILAGKEFNAVTINRKKNGEIYYEEKSITPIRNSDGEITHFLSNSQDITARYKLERQIQESLEHRSHQVRLSTQITQEIAAAPNLPHLYNRIVTLVKETFNYYHVQILQHDPSLDVMALVVGYGQTGEQMVAMHHSMPMGVGLIGTAAATGKTVLRPNIANDPNWQSNPLLPKTKGEIAVPIKMGEAIIGILDVQHDVTGALDENDQILLEGLCGQIAVAIESTRLRQEMEDRLRELDTLQRYMSRDGWKDYQSNKLPVKGFLYSKVGVQPLANDAATAVPVLQPGNGQTVESEKQTDGEINLPLTIRGQSIGSIGIEHDPNKPLTEQDSEFLDAIARQISEALEAARLFEQTQDALSGQEQLATELRTVAEVSTAASTILEVDNLLQTVVELVKLRFGLYHAHIYLVDEESNSLVLRAGAGDVGQIMVLEGRNIRFNADSLVARAARTRKGFIENDVRKIVDFLPHPLLPHTRAEMAIPLIVGSRLIGVMDLQSDKVGFFSEEAMQVQRTLASQIAVAVQNAAMYAIQVETSSKLREVDRLKSEFLASMSHELRTPLNSIIGFADVLLEGLDGDLNERMDQDVRLIKDSGTHLRDLIGDILDMSKIEAGRMELRYEELDLRQMAHDILATANPLAQEKQLDLILDLGDAVSTITADRTRLRQVLWNIMGNAIKFTEKGSVTLGMELEKDMVRIFVRDTGIGIKPEDIDVVFEQFRQVDGSLNRSVGGTGLGMPITKKLVELHGGQIGVDSVPGQGSTFWFTLPFEKPKASREKVGTGPLSALGVSVN
ncbi:MAG: PAS domain S-box protein [Ardenticatenaceae bacterium]|nr:PAS domain S-box protein [Ardenticatenaceae bacterium]MCB9445246.1 PAS domain S-box protein [Ardenticatenaceae bacterium]